MTSLIPGPAPEGMPQPAPMSPPRRRIRLPGRTDPYAPLWVQGSAAGAERLLRPMARVGRAAHSMRLQKRTQEALLALKAEIGSAAVGAGRDQRAHRYLVSRVVTRSPKACRPVAKTPSCIVSLDVDMRVFSSPRPHARRYHGLDGGMPASPFVFREALSHEPAARRRNQPHASKDPVRSPSRWKSTRLGSTARPASPEPFMV